MLTSARQEGAPTRDARFYPRVFGLVVTTLLAYALYLIFKPFFGPILWAVLLALLLFPVNRKLREKLKGKRGLAALILTVAVTVGIVLPAALLTAAFAGQAADLTQRVSETARRYRIMGLQDIVRLPLLSRAVRWVDEKIPVEAEQVQEWIVDGVRAILQLALAKSKFVFVGAIGALVGLTLMIFILYFFFRDGEEIKDRFVRLIPLSESRKKSLATHLSQVVVAVVYGSLFTALVQGVLVGIAFWIAGLPSPVVFGVVSAVVSLIPVVGTGLVLAPATVVLAVKGEWGWAAFMAIWGALVVGLADNFLRPLFISGRAEISTLPVFFGVIGGLAAFGPVGLFLGPVVLALVLALIRFAEESAQKALPEGSGSGSGAEGE